MFMFQTLKLLPAKVGFVDGEVLGVLSFTFGGLALVLVPFISSKNYRYSGVLKVAGIAVLLFILAMTILGYLS
jgi:hypothetical protein